MKTLFQSFNVLLTIGLSLSLLGGLFPKASAKVRQLSRPAKCSAVFFYGFVAFLLHIGEYRAGFAALCVVFLRLICYTAYCRAFGRDGFLGLPFPRK